MLIALLLHNLVPILIVSFHLFRLHETNETVEDDSSTEHESSSESEEPAIRYKAQRSATVPTKQMEEMINSWRSKKFTSNDVNISHSVGM